MKEINMSTENSTIEVQILHLQGILEQIQALTTEGNLLMFLANITRVAEDELRHLKKIRQPSS